MARMKPTRTVKTADTLLSVITNLQRLDGAGVTELAQHLGMAKSSVHGHLSTLQKHGYVVKEGNTYYLSLKFLDHGTYARNRHALCDTVKPSITRLAADTGETVWFAMGEHEELVYLFRAIGERGVNMVCRPGTRVPIHTTAAGKAILASYPNSRVREIAENRKLIERTPNTTTDLNTLLDQLETIRGEDGLAVTTAEDYEGVTSIAAVVSVDERTIGAISVSGPKRRLSGKQSDSMKTSLLETVEAIELRLSGDVCM